MSNFLLFISLNETTLFFRQYIFETFVKFAKTKLLKVKNAHEHEKMVRLNQQYLDYAKISKNAIKRTTSAHLGMKKKPIKFKGRFFKICSIYI